jgi:hypothetical protein
LKTLLIVFLLSLSAFAQHHNDLSWVPGSGGGSVSGFNVKKASVAGGPYTTLTSVPATTLSFSDTSNLVEGQHNFYVVTATGPGGESAPSNEVNLLTPFSLPSKPALSGTAF